MAERRLTRSPSPLWLWPEGLPPWREHRLVRARHLDQPFPALRFESLAAWKRRAAVVRQRVLLAAGLVPMPDKTPLRARVFGRLKRDGYTVEKVYFESRPGFLCTGNLYRPARPQGRVPAVLCPHGHWPRGRLHDDPDPALGSVPARSIALARLGFVAFSYDMIGYQDSLQLPHRPDLLAERASLWGLSLMGLQLWNTIRAIDFVQSLPEVDPTRIGCTGTSGGGSQTFLAAAVDERIRAAVPVCMVSNHMQGGCSCENGPTLRLDTTSVEITALMAPRPLLLVASTQDWTNHTPWHELAALRSIYRLYGAADRVDGVRFDAPHNYNQDSREVMYAWFTRWLKGDRSVGRRVKEPPYQVEEPDRVRVFPTGLASGAPAGLLRGRRLVAALQREAAEAIQREQPAGRASLERFCERYGPALTGSLAAAVPPREDICVCVSHGQIDIPGARLARLWMGRRSAADILMGSLLAPRSRKRTDGPVTLLVHPEGRTALFRGNTTTPGPLLTALLRRGQRVLAIDTYLTGEGQTLAGLAEAFQRMPHFHAYNRSVTAERVQDILTAVGALRHYYGVERIHLVAEGMAAVWALLARAVWPHFERTAVDLRGVQADRDDWWQRRAFIPLVRRAGDVRTAMALAAPGPLWLHGCEGFPAEWARACYRAAGRPEALRLTRGRWRAEAVAAWLAGGEAK